MLTRTDEPLAHWTTLRLGGPARRFLEVSSRDELYAAVRALPAAEPLLLLGGGSNLVIADEGFAGTVIRVASRGVDVASADPCGGAVVTVEAGEDWDAFVARTVEEGWLGVEALAGVPGTVGAVPIQNVGAYGQEVADTLFQVHALDRETGSARPFAAAECGFGYRTSRFKRDPGRFVIGAVTFQFRLGSSSRTVGYAELASRLGVEVGSKAPAAEVRDAVLALRRGKGMVLDPADHDTWSVGSFFTNPFVPAEAVPPGAPAYPQPDGAVKTSAAWLISRSGVSPGYGAGPARVSTKHTLALTNRGSATTADLLDLARDVRAKVQQSFGIVLEPEPTLVGCAL